MLPDWWPFPGSDGERICCHGRPSTWEWATWANEVCPCRDPNSLWIDLRALCISTLISAAQDTTSSALARILHILALCPKEQEKLRNETVHARWKHGDLSYDELMALPYLDAVVRETLRLWVPFSRWGCAVMNRLISQICAFHFCFPHVRDQSTRLTTSLVILEHFSGPVKMPSCP